MKLQPAFPFFEIASSLILYPFVDFMDAAHDIDPFCPRNELQSNLKGADDIQPGKMADDAGVCF